MLEQEKIERLRALHRVFPLAADKPIREWVRDAYKKGLLTLEEDSELGLFVFLYPHTAIYGLFPIVTSKD